MSEAKHSPSPWRAVIEHETLDGMRQDLCPRVNDAEGTCICELWSSTQTITPIGQATQEANARLMAQAPAMLEALRDLIEQLDGIGIPEWSGAEGLDLGQARAALEGL